MFSALSSAGTPLIAEQRLLDTYTFLTPRHVFLRGPDEDEVKGRGVTVRVEVGEEDGVCFLYMRRMVWVTGIHLQVQCSARMCFVYMLSHMLFYTAEGMCSDQHIRSAANE